MNQLRELSFLTFALLGAACMSGRHGPKGPPPVDPMIHVDAAELRSAGLGFARRGDLVRAQQYLSAAMQKGFDETIVVPELVKVCVASSRLRAALAFAEPYLDRHPRDAGMQYVVGTIHMALGNLQRASRHLTGALESESLVRDALFSLALVAEEEGQRDLVRAHLEKYLATSPKGRFASRAKTLLAELGADS